MMLWLLLAAVVGGPAAGAVPAQGSCQARCYQQKAADYQRCRMLPPADRDARVGCFARADDALRRCLAACR
jgi:hypothetical protein